MSAHTGTSQAWRVICDVSLFQKLGHFIFMRQWATLIGMNEAPPPTLYPVLIIHPWKGLPMSTPLCRRHGGREGYGTSQSNLPTWYFNFVFNQYIFGKGNCTNSSRYIFINIFLKRAISLEEEKGQGLKPTLMSMCARACPTHHCINFS